MTDQLPPDACIEKALRLSGYKSLSVQKVKEYPEAWSDLLNVARYIAEKEPELAVDPVVLIVREMMGLGCGALDMGISSQETAKKYRDGGYDADACFVAVLEYIRPRLREDARP